jgi:septum formation topological specificity factor MinE
MNFEFFLKLLEENYILKTWTTTEGYLKEGLEEIVIQKRKEGPQKRDQLRDNLLNVVSLVVLSQ